VFEPVEAAMMGWYNNGWGWGSGFGMLLMLLVWGGLIALGIWAVSRLTRGSGGGQQGQPTLETPRQILDRRFAAGELTAEQYAEARRVLEGRSSTGTTPQA
jgi:putative membrane protein